MTEKMPAKDPLEPYLTGKTELSSLYQESGTEAPRSSVDDTILAAARREVAARPVRTHKSLRRWQIPLSIAATLVITFTLALLVKQENERPTDEGNFQPTPHIVHPAAPVQEETPQLKQEPARAAPITTQSAPAPIKELRKRETDGATLEREEKPISTDATGSAQDEPKARADSFEDKKLNDAQPSLAVPAPSATPEQQTMEKRESVPAAAPMGSANFSGENRFKQKQRSPEQWLDEIKQLKAQGQLAEMEKNLAEFKKQYPDYPLPDELKPSPP